MNKIILSGRLAQDPEQRNTKSGTEMATFNDTPSRIIWRWHVNAAIPRTFSIVSAWARTQNTCSSMG